MKPPFVPPAEEPHFGLRAPINQPHKEFVNNQGHRYPRQYHQKHHQPVHLHRSDKVRRPSYRHNFVADSDYAGFPNHPHHLKMGIPDRRKPPPWVTDLHPRRQFKYPKRQDYSQHFRPLVGYNSSYPDRQVNHRENPERNSPLNQPEKQPQQQQSYPVEGEQPACNNKDIALEKKVENLNLTVTQLKNEHAVEKATVDKLKDELASEKAIVIRLKDELAQEKLQGSRIAEEKSKLEEDLGLRVSLAESEIASKDEEFKCKELTLIDELLLRGEEVDKLKSKIKEMESTVIEAKREAAEAKTHRSELAANLEDYIKKTEIEYLEIKSEKQSMDAKKQRWKNEQCRFESERIDLQARIARLEMELDRMQNKMLVKDEQISEHKILSEKYFALGADNNRLKDTIAAQKKRIHTQEFWVGKTSKLSAELSTWKAKCKAKREETQRLNEQVCKLQREKQELKKKAKTVKSTEKLMASFVTLESKSKEYFEKMLNGMGEIQELRERLSRATQENSVLKRKLEPADESLMNGKVVIEQEGFAETVEATLESAVRDKHEKS